MSVSSSVAEPGRDWYQFGDGCLGVVSEDLPFRDRFRLIFSECRLEAEPDPGRPSVTCRVQCPSASRLSLVSFEDPEALDALGFVLTVFPDRGYRDISGTGSPWRVLGVESAAGEMSIAFEGNCAAAESTAQWQPIIANLAVNRVLRLQRDVLFFHAASVAVAGRGALICGPKGAGKTTLSMSLAARGHAFLGEELAAVRLSTRQLLPFRRAVSIRPGPGSEQVQRLLQERPDLPRERYPDGGVRVRVPMGELFPDARAIEAPLSDAFFLRGFTEQARVETFTPGSQHLQLISPLRSTAWGMPRGLLTVRLLKLLSGVRCHFLDAGDPEATADLVQGILEG
ncbi:MAG: hypothetical protein ABJD11_03835 [Gemmatimonadota bacterium]